MSYDQRYKSYTPASVEALAQLIQTTIEDFIEFDVAMRQP